MIHGGEIRTAGINPELSRVPMGNNFELGKSERNLSNLNKLLEDAIRMHARALVEKENAPNKLSLLKSITGLNKDSSSSHAYLHSATVNYLKELIDVIKKAGLSATEEKRKIGDETRYFLIDEKLNLSGAESEVQGERLEKELNYKPGELKELFHKFFGWREKNNEGYIVRKHSSEDIEQGIQQVSEIYSELDEANSRLLSIIQKISPNGGKDWKQVKSMAFDQVKNPEMAIKLEGVKGEYNSIIGDLANPQSGESVFGWVARIVREALKKQKNK